MSARSVTGAQDGTATGFDYAAMPLVVQLELVAQRGVCVPQQ